MVKHVIGIRTNSWTAFENNLYQQLQTVFPSQDIFVIMEELSREHPVPKGIQKISLNLAFLQDNELLNYQHFNRSVGWLCGDYSYFAFQKQVVADFYWLIEPDVTLTFTSWKNDFFDLFKHNTHHALLANIRPLTENDYWYASSKSIYNKPHGCLFPFSRLSHKAINHCFWERQKLSRHYTKHNSFSNTNNSLGIHFPNDESLVINTLMRDKLSIHDFAETLPQAFEYFDYYHLFGLPEEGLLRPSNQVIHPVRSLEHLAQKLTLELEETIEQSGHLDYLTIQPQDINAFSSHLSHLLALSLSSALSHKTQQTLTMADLKTVVRSKIATAPYPCCLWTYQKHTLVVDMRINNQEWTTDFCLVNNTLICQTFNRNDSQWATLFQSKHPQMTLENNKVKQFDIPCHSIDDIAHDIEQALSVFFDYFKDTY